MPECLPWHTVHGCATSAQYHGLMELWLTQLMTPAGLGQHMASHSYLCPGFEVDCPVLLDHSQVIQGPSLSSALRGTSRSHGHMPGQHDRGLHDPENPEDEWKRQHQNIL